VEWKINKIQGGSELILIAKVSLESPNASICRKEIGPIGMQFEIPTLNISGLSIKSLKTTDKDKETPKRWVRYITQASSYVCRI